MVGARGFEPPASRSQTECSTRLSYAPSGSSTRHPICVQIAPIGPLAEVVRTGRADRVCARGFRIPPHAHLSAGKGEAYLRQRSELGPIFG